MFGAINSVMNSVFGVTPVQTEAEINAMFDAADNKKPARKTPAKPTEARTTITPPVAKPTPTKTPTKAQKKRARQARKKAEAKRLAEASGPTVDTPHHHEPLTTVTHTSVNAKPFVIPAVITAKQQKMIIEILHAATVA